jgi:hypothetical protein
MKILIILTIWLLSGSLLFWCLTKGVDNIYEKYYFNKLSCKQQERVLDWINQDSSAIANHEVKIW